MTSDVIRAPTAVDTVTVTYHNGDHDGVSAHVLPSITDQRIYVMMINGKIRCDQKPILYALCVQLMMGTALYSCTGLHVTRPTCSTVSTIPSETL